MGESTTSPKVISGQHTRLHSTNGRLPTRNRALIIHQIERAPSWRPIGMGRSPTLPANHHIACISMRTRRIGERKMKKILKANTCPHRKEKQANSMITRQAWSSRPLWRKRSQPRPSMSWISWNRAQEAGQTARKLTSRNTNKSSWAN